MDRQTVYPGQILPETTLLNMAKDSMIGAAKLAAVIVGVSTMFNGLACTATIPPSMQVVIAPGEVYSLENMDGTAYSSLPADTVHQIVKQGLLMDAVNLSCPAPVTAGFSINYLVQAAYQDVDAGPVVLPYYNSSNPAQAYSGPDNSGDAQTTVRQGLCQVVVKVGVAATSGAQVTPAPDPGYIGLYVVTVAHSATTITGANISQASNAPILPAGGLVEAIQSGAMTYGIDTGAANACVVNFAPAIPALIDGMEFWFKAKVTNTGFTTLNVNGIGAGGILGGNNASLQGGEIVANGRCHVIWNATLGAFNLIECTGGALQVAPATQSQHAMQLGQATGRLLNIRFFSTVGSSTYTPTTGTNSIDVHVFGGGGAGGGSSSTGAGQASAGPGGGAGGWARKRVTAGFSGANITVGAGGLGVNASTGGSGGTSSFGAFCSATGGAGAAAGIVAAVSTVSINGAATGGAGSGGDVNGIGGLGNYAFYAAVPVSGKGGASVLGEGAGFVNTAGGSHGASAVSLGSGGSGAATAPGQGFSGTGGNGAPGLVIIYEYA